MTTQTESLSQEEIIMPPYLNAAYEGDDLYTGDQMRKFMKLVASAASAKEREEIAQFIEKTHLGSLPEETAVHYALLLKSYSTAIRARGEA